MKRLFLVFLVVLMVAVVPVVATAFVPFGTTHFAKAQPAMSTLQVQPVQPVLASAAASVDRHVAPTSTALDTGQDGLVVTKTDDAKAMPATTDVGGQILVAKMADTGNDLTKGIEAKMDGMLAMADDTKKMAAGHSYTVDVRTLAG